MFWALSITTREEWQSISFGLLYWLPNPLQFGSFLLLPMAYSKVQYARQPARRGSPRPEEGDTIGEGSRADRAGAGGAKEGWCRSCLPVLFQLQRSPFLVVTAGGAGGAGGGSYPRGPPSSPVRFAFISSALMLHVARRDAAAGAAALC